MVFGPHQRTVLFSKNNISFRVVLDARSVGKKISGVSRSATKIVSTLSQLETDLHFIVVVGERDHLPALSPNFSIIESPYNRLNPFGDFLLFWRLRKEKPFIIHILHAYLPLFLIRRAKYLTSIYDVFARDRRFFSGRRSFDKFASGFYDFLLRRTVLRSRSIIVPTDFVAGELSKYEHTNSKVIKLPLSAGLRPEASAESKCFLEQIKKNYVLYVGNNKFYKGLNSLLDAYVLSGFMQSSDWALRLVVNSDFDQVNEMVVKKGLSSRTEIHYRPKDPKLSQFYSESRLLVIPSLAEGFGLVLAEGEAFGIPIICSKAESFYEHETEVFTRFKPGDVDDLKESLNKFLREFPDKSRMSKRGTAALNRNGWDNYALSLLKLYKSHMPEGL